MRDPMHCFKTCQTFTPFWNYYLGFKQRERHNSFLLLCKTFDLPSYCVIRELKVTFTANGKVEIQVGKSSK